MATRCARPIKGTHLRITKVDECGVPITGASSAQIVTKGFVSVGMEGEYEDGEEFFVRNADGEACVNETDAPTLKYFELTTDFCEIDPDIAVVVWGGRLLTSGTPASGTGFAISEGTTTAHFSMEVWQRIAGAGACDAAGTQRFIYHAWPNVRNTQVGEYTIENGTSTLQFVAQSDGASPLWNIGTSYLSGNPEVDEHWLFNITTTAPPEPSCGAVLI